MNALIKVLCILFLFNTIAFSDVVLDSKHQNIELLGIPFFEDTEGNLTLKEIQTKVFSESEEKVASFGFTSSVYWFKVALSANKSADDYKWWLNVSYPLLEKIDLYICDDQDNLLAVKKSGKARPFSERELHDRHFLFRIATPDKQTLYLRVETQSAMQVPASIETTEHLFTDYHHSLVLSGIYYGIFVLIFFYNLISFIYTRSRSYFLYLLFIVSFTIWQLSLDGLGIELLWTECEWMISHGNSTMMGVMILSIVMFTREFLQTKSFTPRIDKFFIALSIFISVVTIAAFFRPYKEVILYFAATSVFLPPLLLLTGLIVYQKNYYPARFYILGWGLFLLGSVLFALNKFAVIEGYEFFSYAQQIGSALQMIFLSWALADSLKKSETEYINKLSGLNTLLQEKVSESLSQMRQHDQVMIEKSRLAAMGEMIEQIAHQWRQPLHSLSLLNQDLYFKIQLKTVTQEDYENIHNKMNEQLQYMSQTIEDFRNFSKPDKEQEQFNVEEVIESALNLSEGSLKYAKVKASLVSEKEHPVFGMRHEMMQVFMNLIKNTQDVVSQRKIEEPWLIFTVKEEDNIIKVTVEDNAKGIDEDKLEKVFEPYFSTKTTLNSSGIGLYMSKEIIEKSFLGTMNVTNSVNGALFTISLPKGSAEVSLD